MSKQVQGWEVSVSINGDEVLTIGHNHLSGIENIMDYADTVRGCAQHLLSFIGPEHQDDFLNYRPAVIPCYKSPNCSWPACAQDCDGRPGHATPPVPSPDRHHVENVDAGASLSDAKK